MPNHTTNHIDIWTTNKDLLKKIEKGFASHTLMKTFHPMPKELEGTTAPKDTPNWYDWCVNNWGTKWDVYSYGEPTKRFKSAIIEKEDFSIDINRDFLKPRKYYELSVEFLTAWSPPTQFFDYLMDNELEILQIHNKFIDEGGFYIGQSNWERPNEEDEVEYSEYIYTNMEEFVDNVNDGIEMKNKYAEKSLYNLFEDNLLWMTGEVEE